MSSLLLWKSVQFDVELISPHCSRGVFRWRIEQNISPPSLTMPESESRDALLPSMNASQSYFLGGRGKNVGKIGGAQVLMGM
jgi:hypothetical protein